MEIAPEVPVISPVLGSSFGAVTFIVIGLALEASASFAAIAANCALRASFSWVRFGRIAMLASPRVAPIGGLPWRRLQRLTSARRGQVTKCYNDGALQHGRTEGAVQHRLGQSQPNGAKRQP